MNPVASCVDQRRDGTLFSEFEQQFPDHYHKIFKKERDEGCVSLQDRNGDIRWIDTRSLRRVNAFHARSFVVLSDGEGYQWDLKGLSVPQYNGRIDPTPVAQTMPYRIDRLVAASEITGIMEKVTRLKQLGLKTEEVVGVFYPTDLFRNPQTVLNYVDWCKSVEVDLCTIQGLDLIEACKRKAKLNFVNLSSRYVSERFLEKLREDFPKGKLNPRTILRKMPLGLRICDFFVANVADHQVSARIGHMDGQIIVRSDVSSPKYLDGVDPAVFVRALERSALPRKRSLAQRVRDFARPDSYNPKLNEVTSTYKTEKVVRNVFDYLRAVNLQDLDSKNSENLKQYFSEILPHEMGRFLGVIHHNGYTHGNCHEQNWVLEGTLVDLDSMCGGEFGEPDCGFEKQKMDDIERSIESLGILFGIKTITVMLSYYKSLDNHSFFTQIGLDRMELYKTAIKVFRESYDMNYKMRRELLPHKRLRFSGDDPMIIERAKK